MCRLCLPAGRQPGPWGSWHLRPVMAEKIKDALPAKAEARVGGAGSPVLLQPGSVSAGPAEPRPGSRWGSRKGLVCSPPRAPQRGPPGQELGGSAVTSGPAKVLPRFPPCAGPRWASRRPPQLGSSPGAPPPLRAGRGPRTRASSQRPRPSGALRAARLPRGLLKRSHTLSVAPPSSLRVHGNHCQTL